MRDTARMQAALMAQEESVAPARIVAASAAFNLVADVALIAGCRLGLAGAAIATVATQYLALGALLYTCYRPGRLRPRLRAPAPPGAMGTAPPPSPLVATTAAVAAALPPSAEGLALGSPPPSGATAPPTGVRSPQAVVDAALGTASESNADAAPIAEQQGRSGSGAAAALLTAVYAAKLVCYFVVQGAAMRLPVAQLAAHNAIFSLWNVCAFFPVPLQTTALAFVPRASSVQARPPPTGSLSL